MPRLYVGIIPGIMPCSRSWKDVAELRLYVEILRLFLEAECRLYFAHFDHVAGRELPLAV